ncbi:MAG TPA: D-alanyl-D-alanine carboxypeptidase family protein [Syntrophomonas sp.]|nr:D-alanyl-D-alanine carboxypeptidase family protein [Syntrophomonas sp.]HRW11688.1 D-alanyl-D-alanine carboxypeptidase family protein [Syntrophomonas sp.]
MSLSCKSLFSILLIGLYLFLPVSHFSAAGTVDVSSLSAASYVLMDAESGKVLKSHLPHQQLPPASTTKLMTMLLALESIEQGQIAKTELVTASRKASETDGSRIYLEVGETMRLDDLLKSMALASANDASVAVAEKISGSEAKFVTRMNSKAKEIGMQDSHFVNVSGLPAEHHYSSAYDLALLARYTLAHTEILNYSSLKQHTLRDGTFPLYNGNRLLWTYAGADGLKNGYTSEAKNCLIATAQRGHLRLIAVVLGCPLRGGQTSDVTHLLDYGFDKYDAIMLIPRGEICGTVRVKAGSVKEVEAVLQDELNAIYAKSDGIHFTRRLELPEKVEAPVTKGQVLGKMEILSNSKQLMNVELIAAKDIPRLSLLGQFLHMHWILKLLLFFFLLTAFLFYARHRIHKNGGRWKKPKSRIRHPYDQHYQDYRY